MNDDADQKKKTYGFVVYDPDGAERAGQARLDINPSVREVKQALSQFISGEIEHVTIMRPNSNDGAADMFVDEMGVMKGLPRNEKATELYRAWWLYHHPHDDPESLPWIAGVAIVFDELVWS